MGLLDRRRDLAESAQGKQESLTALTKAHAALEKEHAAREQQIQEMSKQVRVSNVVLSSYLYHHQQQSRMCRIVTSRIEMFSSILPGFPGDARKAQRTASSCGGNQVPLNHVVPLTA